MLRIVILAETSWWRQMQGGKDSSSAVEVRTAEGVNTSTHLHYYEGTS